MTKKNYAIEFYRVIATLIICIHHMQGKCGLSIFTHGDLLVDFFFILSGLFLAGSFIREKEHSGSRYFIKRVKRLYPEYLWAAIIAIISYSIIGKFDVNLALPELFMVQNTGLFSGGFNYPCWYLSTLMIAGFLIYEFLKYNKDLFVKIIAPLLVLAGYTFYFVNWSPAFIWSTRGCIYIPMLRCICGMTLGVFICYLSKCDFIKRIGKGFGTAAELACLAVAGVGVVTDIFSASVIVSALAVLVFLTYNQCGLLSEKVFNQKCFGFAGGYSYSVYLNHGIFANFLDTVNQSYLHMGKSLILVYLAAVIVYSAVTHHVISFAFGKIENRKKKTA